MSDLRPPPDDIDTDWIEMETVTDAPPTGMFIGLGLFAVALMLALVLIVEWSS
jgi:hypothetical protein